MRRQSRRWGLWAVLMLVALGGTAAWATQVDPMSTKPTIDASMSELVTEVRSLRLAVERSGIIATQAQVVLGRLQLQENRLGTLGRQLQEARMRTLDAQQARNEIARNVASLTERMDSSSVSAEERQQVQLAIADTKRRLKELEARLEMFRAEESAASAALSEEQSRWSDFNTRLETLERTLATMGMPRP